MKRQGKTILISLLVAAALMIAACAGPASPDAGAPQTQAQTTPEPSANEKETQTAAPEVTPLFGAFKAEDSNGNEVTQEIFAGHKLTMVNIWATFCGPCLREMPELGELDEEYRDQGFQVVGMPTDVIDQDGAIDPEQVALVNEIAEKTGADYPHILPTQELVDAKLGSVTAVPETVFVDENGNQVGESYRGARDKAAWKEIIDGLLASMPEPDKPAE
ncbi:TlpA family protein disulfide reductase [Christensenella timonensis]|uniref:TlpA family protein disulfide reductase n=1 Tax=Christensenella timonensis TaxID=1816678 RepID=UPI00082C1752|nr:TlpA disulfide reductase family protein [Christensenella timonensis]